MTRLSLDIDQHFDAALKEFSNSGDSMSGKAKVIQNAVSTYKFLKDKVAEANGNRLAIVDKDGKILNDVQLP